MPKIAVKLLREDIERYRQSCLEVLVHHLRDPMNSPPATRSVANVVDNLQALELLQASDDPAPDSIRVLADVGGTDAFIMPNGEVLGTLPAGTLVEIDPASGLPVGMIPPKKGKGK